MFKGLTDFFFFLGGGGREGEFLECNFVNFQKNPRAKRIRSDATGVQVQYKLREERAFLFLLRKKSENYLNFQARGTI